MTASTAYRLLNDFEKLEEGDVVVQNGGSGLVAQLVVQLAEKRGVKVITILRDRLLLLFLIFFFFFFFFLILIFFFFFLIFSPPPPFFFLFSFNILLFN